MKNPIFANLSKYASERIYKPFIAVNPSEKGLATWYASLKIAYAEIKLSKEIASVAESLNSFEDFRKLSEMEQYNTLKQLASLVPKIAMRTYRIKVNEITGNNEAVFESASEIAWMIPKRNGGKALIPWDEALDMIVNASYIRLAEKSDYYAEKGLSFRQTLVKCVFLSAKQIGRKIQDKPTRQRQDTLSMQDESFHIVSSYPSPEVDTIGKLAIMESARDEADKQIMLGKAYGLTQAELGKRLEMSQVAISKRIKACYRRYNEAKAETVDTLIKSDLRKAVGDITSGTVINGKVKSIK